MATSAYAPYRSEAVRDACFAYFDSRAAKEWPIPSEARSVTTSFGPTFVRISGPGNAPPLVLLPGATAPSLMWTPNIEALSTHFHTFAVDQIGDFGRSLCVKPIRTFDDLRAWLNELFDALELRDGINLVGMSFGGALAAQYALRYPERLHKVVLLAPGATVCRLSAKFVVRLILAAIASQRLMPWVMRWIFADMVRKDPHWLDATMEQIFLNIRSMQHRTMPLPAVLTDAEWGSLKVPSLFLVGENEVIYSAQKAVSRLQRVAPIVTPEIIPGAGHDLTFVQAAMVNERILEYLRH